VFDNLFLLISDWCDSPSPADSFIQQFFRDRWIEFRDVKRNKDVVRFIVKGTMSTTMHCALKQCLAAILLAE
jgi:hypothetical protein